MKVEKHAAPFLPLNPNVRSKNDEAHVSHVTRDSREQNQREKDKSRGSIIGANNNDINDANARKQRTSPKYPTYAQLLLKQQEEAAEEERLRK